MEMKSVTMEITYKDGSVQKCIIKDMNGTITIAEEGSKPIIELYGTVYETSFKGKDISDPIALIRMIRI